MKSLAVELQGLSKSFGKIQANSGIDLRVEKGSIHAIVGENGAGKSTAMKMLYGMIRPDSGIIRVNGIEKKWSSPRGAISAGIGMVHQHFMLAEPETALENMLLEGAPFSNAFRFLPSYLRPIRRSETRSRLERLAKKYGLFVDWDKKIQDLPVGVQQRVEILKLLHHEASILILDEPTAVLTPQETEQLFIHLRALAAEGRTVLIITHKLKEVMAVADRVTVFRAGKVVGHREISQTSPEDLAGLMVGRSVNLRASAPPEKAPGLAVLELKNVNIPGKLAELSFSVREGEIVGIAGVEGNGQTELLQLLANPWDFSKRSQGELRYFSESAWSWSAARVRQAGVGIVPEDRLSEALLMESSLVDNFLLGLQKHKAFRNSLGIIDRVAVRKRAEAAIREFDIRPPVPEAIAGRLSGGNQQKLVIARELEFKPKLLIAAQPTRGVDVGAIELIHERILRVRNGGAGVLLVSSELDEILSLSDRVLVIYEGRIVADLPRQQANERQVGLFMGGGRE